VFGLNRQLGWDSLGAVRRRWSWAGRPAFGSHYQFSRCSGVVWWQRGSVIQSIGLMVIVFLSLFLVLHGDVLLFFVIVTFVDGVVTDVSYDIGGFGVSCDVGVLGEVSVVSGTFLG